ncbi:MAG: TlpA family protein disulfide reductase [Sphingomonas sp.]
MRVALICCAVLALAACHKSEQPAPNQTAPSAESGPVKGVDRSHHGKPAPDAQFSTPDGTAITLAKFRGVPVLLNFWATWCAPCVKELPTLDKLAASHREDGQLGVLAVSQDSAPKASVEAFLKKLKVGDLGAYRDPKMTLAGGLGAEVLPTSILFDANGKEVWRYVGDLDWTSPEAAKLLAEGGVGQKKG